MSRPLIFLKYGIFSDKILSNTKFFLGLNKIEFNFLIAGIFLSQNKTNKSGIFNGEQILDMNFKLTGEKYKRIDYARKVFNKLISKGYFIFVANKLEKYDQMPYFKFDDKKLVYFLSVLNAFVDSEVNRYKMKEIKELPLRYIAQKDVLKHIRNIKKYIKSK